MRPARPGFSVVGRLVVRVIALTLVLIVAVIGALVYTLQDSVDTLRDRSLQGQAFDIARHLTQRGDGTIAITLPPLLGRTYAAQPRDVAFAIVDENGVVLGSANSGGAALDLSLRHDAAEFVGIERPDGPGFVYSMPWEIGAKRVWIQVLQGANHDDVLKDSIIVDLLSEGAWIVGLFSAILLFIIYLTIRFSLRPLIEVSEQARAIGPDTLDARLSAVNLPREIAPLVTAFNGALDRLTEAYRVQRDFTANAAHELKTPLAVLRANLEAAGCATDGARFTADLDRLNRIITQLLRCAELDFLVPSRFVPTDLHAIAVSVVGFIAPVVMEQGKEIEVIGERPNLVNGDPVILTHALRNLVENAMQHTPQGSTISVDVAAPARLSVRDHGPGVPPAARKAIFRRFWRGAGERPSHGAGLGLSIVQQIVQAHRGTITADEAPGGGALFTMTFPAPRPARP